MELRDLETKMSLQEVSQQEYVIYGCLHNRQAS